MSSYFLEIFAGTARISAAAADLGLNVAPPIEIANSIAFDATTSRLWVTGKKWPKLYEVEIRETPTHADYTTRIADARHRCMK